VDARGALVVDGRSFATPSAAACTAAGLRQMDGWSAWATDGGSSLHTLRAQLLDSIADDARAAEHARGTIQEEPDDVDLDFRAPTSLLPRHDFLKDARRAAETGEPLTLPVRTLLAHWGGNAREQRITRSIEADLANFGLVSRPNFLQVSIDDDVTLVVVDPEPEPEPVIQSAPISEPISVRPVSVELAEAPEIGLTLGNLTSATRKLVFVKPTATFAEAMTLMLINDYSQLPVLQSKHTCIGAVTWKSIAYAQLKDSDAPFSAAIVEVQPQPYSRDLHSMLPVLRADEFVVVTDSHNAISGIVTTADVVRVYGERTLPFLLIGELDQELRQIMYGFDLETLRAACAHSGPTNLKSHDDMTMYNYQQVLSNPECWSMLGWPLDRKAFVHRLDELRQIRNDVMHFNPDGVPEGTVEQLRHMLALIREFVSAESE
jgi:predicted transcriptional regulator